VLITLFYIPNPDEETASSLGNLAIENKLAACSNVFPINSIFPWKDAIQNNSEFVLILKTILSKKSGLVKFIEDNHPYELPCIINWDVEVNDTYGAWIERNVS